MNAQRRKALAKVIGMLSDARNLLEEIQQEEQEAFDGMPENLQSSERGEKLEDNAMVMDDIVCSIEEHESELDEIINA
jgi:hypothetical protein